MDIIKLDKRLTTIKSFISNDSIILDIGTDHGYLPIACLLENKSRFAIASDINEGPLNNAKRNAIKNNVDNQCKFVLTNGIDDSLFDSYNITDILICGMGGELIESILSNSIITKNSKYKFILQPMTKVGELRKWLSNNGYSIEDETISLDGDKFYNIIVCRYVGYNISISNIECLVGPININNLSDNVKMYISHLIKSYTNKINGMNKGGIDFSEESEILDSLKQLIK